MYNPFQYSPFQLPPMQMPQQQTVLPPQQVLKANGKASIDAIRMSPNSSALVMDSTAPMVWLCTSDSLANVTSTAYDIKPHVEDPPAESVLEARLSAVEANVNNILSKMEGMTSVEPHDDAAKQEPAVKPTAEYHANGTNLWQSRSNDADRTSE